MDPSPAPTPEGLFLSRLRLLTMSRALFEWPFSMLSTHRVPGEVVAASSTVRRTPSVAWLKSRDGVHSTSEACRPTRHSTPQPPLLSLHVPEGHPFWNDSIVVSLPDEIYLLNVPSVTRMNKLVRGCRSWLYSGFVILTIAKTNCCQNAIHFGDERRVIA